MENASSQEYDSGEQMKPDELSDEDKRTETSIRVVVEDEDELTLIESVIDNLGYDRGTAHCQVSPRANEVTTGR